MSCAVIEAIGDVECTLPCPALTLGETPARIPIVKRPPLAACVACVVIPARDEADSIERTLTALAAQQDLAGRPVDPDTLELILLANNCRDETATIARRLAGRSGTPALHVVELELPPEQAHVGMARRIGMDEAYRRLASIGRPRGLIATTDADTLVSPTWIAAMLHELERGADAVGGRILVAADERRAMAPAVRSRFLRNVGYWALANEVDARLDPRPGDPWPCHEQFFGASLAVTVRAYRAVGGLTVLPSGEDAALAAALRRADIEIRHSLDVRVHTSGRLDGRTPAGLAALLAGWSHLTADDDFQRVPGVESVVARATCRRAVRDLWRRARSWRGQCANEIAHLAELAGVPEAWLFQVVAGNDRLGTLLEAFEQRSVWNRHPELVDVREAIDGLRTWLEPFRRGPAHAPTFARQVRGLPFLPPTHPNRRRLRAVRPPAALATLEEVEAVGERAAPLAPPPHVA